MTLAPQAFGPGFSRLGVIRIYARAGLARGAIRIVAELEGGTRCVIHLIVE